MKLKKFIEKIEIEDIKKFDNKYIDYLLLSSMLFFFIWGVIIISKCI